MVKEDEGFYADYYAPKVLAMIKGIDLAEVGFGPGAAGTQSNENDI